MLKQRVATATVLALLVLTAVFWFPTPWFALILALFLLIAATEWCTLAGWHAGQKRMRWLALVGAGLLTTWLFKESLIPALIAVGSAWWLWVVLMLLFSLEFQRSDFSKTLAGALVLVPAWASLVYLHQENVFLVMALFMIVWLADIGAFFAGRQWGSHKLAPKLSPGKTIEGVVGGIVLVSLFSVIVAMWQSYDAVCALLWLGVCVITTLFSVVGDLWESKMKRAVDIKDSGSILPGHGGVLDRIDSITAAAPVFAALTYVATRRIGHCIGIQ